MNTLDQFANHISNLDLRFEEDKTKFQNCISIFIIDKISSSDNLECGNYMELIKSARYVANKLPENKVEDFFDECWNVLRNLENAISKISPYLLMTKIDDSIECGELDE